MVRVAAVALAVLVGTTVAAFAQDAVGIDIIEYGIYSAETVTPASEANADMKSATIKNICHLMTTLVVPAKDNLNFGLRYRVRGGKPGQIVDVKTSIRFPDHMNPPESLATYAINEKTMRYRAGATSYKGWTMWHTYPGLWAFSFSVADRKLAEINFTVVEKDQVRVEVDGNSTCFQSS
jgi:hypothetical protein